MDSTKTEEVVAELARRADEGNNAFMNGDMARWLDLIPRCSDFSVMTPFGGWTVGDSYLSSGRLAETAAFFRSATTSFELLRSHATQDIVLLVGIERQRGIVGGLPEQDWSLRVTMVYRREGSEWLLVHRHSDALVNRITLEKLSTLADG
ncbi:MAG: DUF4440 domain-containing protein [Cereibacter sphaeroides]|uniref:DUF4440 domain-containing protein n=1 Tax=Cereibacter sphaeroides TaxID=1063 RepID=A0A2W5SH35_CERSP|nr:MAG: DUF4440 domain-containing protein [Cereibacter sphaeroides]